ncbi:MAG TPA: hypothetical protein VGQ57_15575, partial [Polyangiaceae bacterium]|nr:hypothetical protein [Polyangiaceae bacterium]
TIPNSEAWLDFRPRHERFAAGLEVVARSIARDPETAAATLRRVVAEKAKHGWGRADRAGETGAR